MASGGGDCPELAMEGLKLALENSPNKSFILVLTDASAKDHDNTALVNEVFSLLNETQSQVRRMANSNLFIKMLFSLLIGSIHRRCRHASPIQGCGGEHIPHALLASPCHCVILFY